MSTINKTLNGPKKLVLISAGRYDYAEVELSGAVQLVGPNNAGKTTLIATLQFLYIDAWDEMCFGEYSLEQTREYYFRNQYSYILFECLGERGTFVFGWRGHSKIANKDPQRFHYEGEFLQEDFFDEDGQVREPEDVSARLSLKHYRILKNAQKHREFLLPPTKVETRSAGIVALRQNDDFHHFRETFKNLLTLSSVTQDQMRERLLMLAGMSESKIALDIRKVFGQAYEDIIRRRQELRAFKANRERVMELLRVFGERDQARSEIAYRWKELRPKRADFEEKHRANLREVKRLAGEATERVKELKVQIEAQRGSLGVLQREAGGLTERLKLLGEQTTRFQDFECKFPETRLKNLGDDISEIEVRLGVAEPESRERVERKLKSYRGQVKNLARTISQFDRALVTVLRAHISDGELAPLTRLFSPDLLQSPVGDDGILMKSEDGLVAVLRSIGGRIHSNVYSDANVDVPVADGAENLASLASLPVVREQLAEAKRALSQWEAILKTLDDREELVGQLKDKRDEVELLRREIYEWEQYKKEKEGEALLKSRQGKVEKEIGQANVDITRNETEIEKKNRYVNTLGQTEKNHQDAYDHVMQRFELCRMPDLASRMAEPAEPLPEEFGLAVEVFLMEQRKIAELDQGISDELLSLEKAIGDEYVGANQDETISLLHQGIEAFADREKAIKHDWEHQFQEFRALFSEVLTSLNEIRSAAEKFRRSLSDVQVSNLQATSMDIEEHSDIVEPLRRVANIDQPELFNDDPAAERSLDALRKRFENSPILRYTDLFTMVFTVTGEDGEEHRHLDFTQVESHGTTITIKVLFSLLVLRSLLQGSVKGPAFCEIPFFLDEIHSLDPTNRYAIVDMARRLGFIAITAAPASIGEVDMLYYLKAKKGRIVLRKGHRIGVKRAAGGM